MARWERRKIFKSAKVFKTMKTSAGVLNVNQVSLKKYRRLYCRVKLRRLPSLQTQILRIDIKASLGTSTEPT